MPYNIYNWGMEGGADVERCIDKMEKRIMSSPKGTAFIVNDFTDIMSYETAKKAISKLEKQKKIRHIMRGIYDNPAYSTLIQEYAEPKPNEIAHALARNNCWTIALSGDAALNQLGISTQVPANWLYVSSGPYKRYEIGNITIEFVHRSDRYISGMSEMTATIIQAIKTLGKQRITIEIIEQLAGRIDPDTKSLLLEESRMTTTWVYSVIKKICPNRQNFITLS